MSTIDIVRARFAQAADKIGAKLPPAADAHFRQAASALRSTDGPEWIRISVVYREIAQALRALGGRPQAVSGQLIVDAIDGWLSEIEGRFA